MVRKFAILLIVASFALAQVGDAIQKNGVVMRFVIDTSATPLFTKIIAESLEDLGYKYILTQNFSNSKDGASWDIYINTNHYVDNSQFIKALSKRNVIIKNSTISGNLYFYHLNLAKAVIKTPFYEYDKFIELSRPIDGYMLKINGAKSIEIISKRGNNWFVNIKILDKDMNLLLWEKREKALNSFTMPFPKNSFYIIIDDAKNIENIKRGLDIFIHSKS